jgi:predicted small secreted protein
MGFVIVAVIVLGAIAIVGGGHTFDGMGKDTRVTSDKISNEIKK